MHPFIAGNILVNPTKGFMWNLRAFFIGHMFMIDVDAYSVCVMNSSTTQVTIEKPREVSATYDLSILLVIDNGPCFTRDEFNLFLKSNVHCSLSSILQWSGCAYGAHPQRGTEEVKNGRECNPQKPSILFPLLF